MNNRQISLPSLFILIGLVSLFLALRQSFVFTDSGNPIARAHLLPPFVACLAVVLDRIRYHNSSFKSSAILGAVASTIVATALTIEIAEGLRRIRYWDWVSDLPTFCFIVGGHAVLGSLLGCVIAGVFAAFQLRASS